MPQPTVKELMEIAKRPHKAYGLILPACDYLSYYFSKPFLYLPFSPNQITVFWILIKLLAAIPLIAGNYLLTIGCLFVFQAASILDGVDGVIARYRKIFSLNGKYLDLLGHYLCNSILFIALAWGLYSKTDSVVVFIPAGIAIFCMLLSKALTINPLWYQQEQRSSIEKLIAEDQDSLIKEQKTGLAKGWKQKGVLLFFDVTRIDNPFNLLFWGFVAGYGEITLWVYALLLLLELGRKIAAQFLRIYRAERFDN